MGEVASAFGPVDPDVGRRWLGLQGGVKGVMWDLEPGGAVAGGTQAWAARWSQTHSAHRKVVRGACLGVKFQGSVLRGSQESLDSGTVLQNQVALEAGGGEGWAGAPGAPAVISRGRGLRGHLCPACHFVVADTVGLLEGQGGVADSRGPGHLFWLTL